MARAKKNMGVMIPKGVATFLPHAARERRRIVSRLLAAMEGWGYEEIVTPTFEYLDVLHEGLGEGLAEKSIKFVDRATGRMVILRPDITPQIARIVAMLLPDEPRPLRLSYSANVFRHEEAHAGREREISQIGGELVGLPGPDADAEVVALAAECLLSLGLDHFQIALGQIGFVRSILGDSALSPAAFQKMAEAVSRKDVGRLETLLVREGIGRKERARVLEVLELFGREEVFARAAKITTGTRSKAALARLKNVYEQLRGYGLEKKILIDLGEIRGFDYYTGILFEIFIEGMGESIGGGGRYDNLLGKFGKPEPATGFAFDLEGIQDAIARSGSGESPSPPDVVLVNGGKGPSSAIGLVLLLRRRGVRAIHWPGKDPARAVAYARQRGISKVIVRSGAGEKPFRQILGPNAKGGGRYNEKELLRVLTARP